MKQILRVLEAAAQGSRTSIEIASVTGLPVKHCAAYLRELRLMGLVRIIGKRRFNREGIPAFEYIVRPPS